MILRFFMTTSLLKISLSFLRKIGTAVTLSTSFLFTLDSKPCKSSGVVFNSSKSNLPTSDTNVAKSMMMHQRLLLFYIRRIMRKIYFKFYITMWSLQFRKIFNYIYIFKLCFCLVIVYRSKDFLPLRSYIICTYGTLSSTFLITNTSFIQFCV